MMNNKTITIDSRARLIESTKADTLAEGKED